MFTIGLVLFLTSCTKEDYSKPELTISSVANISQTTVTIEANIDADGGSAVSERGLCWSETDNPTIELNSKKSEGKGSGIFVSSLSGLTSNTTYCVRAYATNAAGTNYSKQVFIRTYLGTVTDIDGNIYNTIKLGTQTWMVENLKTIHYQNGDPIPNITDNNDWLSARSGAWCTYHNVQNVDSLAIFGRLYNLYAVTGTRSIAPTGWHVPSNDEWTILIEYLKDNGYGFYGSRDQITKSMASTFGWISQREDMVALVGSNQMSNNKSGFTGFPHGYRLYSGGFIEKGLLCCWWSTTMDGTSAAWIMGFNGSGNVETRFSLDRSCGLSIRCIKNL